MTEPALYIHAGAHRTGTSSFQMCLHDNARALRKAGYGLAYPGRDGIPSGDLALRLPGPKAGPKPHFVEKAHAALSDRAQGRDLILSEENILGRMFHFMQGQFYPAASQRCAVLRAAWPGPVRHVVLVVRPYAALFASQYRKRAEDNAVPPFVELRPSYLRMDRGWPEIAEILREQLQPEQLTIVPYAARGSSTDLLIRLVPALAELDLKEPGKIINLSATDAALMALQDRYRAGETLRRAMWKSVIEEHQDDTSDKGFARFSDHEERQLQERFDTDLERIAAMPGVTFVPSSPDA